MLEPWLAFFHISAFLGWIVFASAQAAMCRAEWLNPAGVQRLVRLDAILWIATAAVLLSGLARIYWGAKGSAWYWSNWLLWAKLTLFIVVAVMQIGPARRFRNWRDRLAAGGAMPSDADIRGARRTVMIATHLVAVIPLAAVFLARGW
ncbi:MAG: DUF2214 family protein [Pseudomonadota bacterium]|nr:DUF2214 family protein [Pseudomonadota bacterium]